jgi:hypothetical protein
VHHQPIATDCEFVGVKCVDAGFAAGKLGKGIQCMGHGARSAEEWQVDTMEMAENPLLSMGTADWDNLRLNPPMICASIRHSFFIRPQRR